MSEMDLSWLGLFAGIGVAAACGLRAFLPLLFIGIGARIGLIELHSGSEWLASDPALLCFGAATVFEIAADKIPVVDHVLDVIGTVLRPAAAGLGAYALLVNWPTPWAQIMALLLGGGALALHAVKAKLRLGSSAVTLGHANPLLSVAEDATAATLLIAAILAPLIAFLLVVLLFVALARRRRRRLAAASGPHMTPGTSDRLASRP
jgi:hypothetical protein